MRFVNSSAQPCGARNIQVKIVARELYKKLGNVWGSTQLLCRSCDTHLALCTL